MAFKLDNTRKNSTAPPSPGAFKQGNGQTLREKDQGGISGLLQKEITIFGNTFSNKKKEDFYTEVSVLLKAGITLKEALTLIKENQKKKNLQEFHADLIEQLISGKNFSDSIQGKKEFSEYEYHSLKIGEETGTLEKVTEELGSFFSRKNEQRRNLISALMYPVIILATAVFVVAFMLRFVVPMFQDIFTQNNVELPGVTRFIISLSGFSQGKGWIFLVLVVIFLVLRKTLSKKKWYKKIKDNVLLKLPFIGPFVKNVYLVQFTQAVSLLTASKVPVVNSIRLVKKMISFYPLQQALEEVETSILQGKSLSESLKQARIFDHKMVALVKVAEETNQTEFIFERLNHQYNVEVQQKSKMLSTMMEPFIILFVGIIVGVILIAMYLPMFRLSSVLG
ncbi:type II secretion system F family protein [Sinomicrobium pectinilyticum]|uniref:Type II secretion system F family protein n=1 Tax=Sinomicrobium pectinilyticum TaxID=1084421 RepID=A0A3N0EL31_SINP1|nr:type II secretion system F family protein [Sinomicrobium pectinilyticum]RNL88504.1 type II secretion system F family protein [Sinomicrobium pectinilyticum]